MPTYYVSPTGSGNQDGSSPADSWTLDQFHQSGVITGNVTDTIRFAPGTYDASVPVPGKSLFAHTIYQPDIDGSEVNINYTGTGTFFNNSGQRFQFFNLNVFSSTAGRLFNMQNTDHLIQDCTLHIDGPSAVDALYLNVLRGSTFQAVRCKITSVSSDGAVQLLRGAIQNCLVSGGKHGIRAELLGSTISGCVVQSGYHPVIFTPSSFFANCVLLNSPLGSWENTVIGNVLSRPFDGSFGSINIGEDPFVDRASFDLRLTDKAKAVQAFPHLMLKIVGTPGIVMDSSEELLSLVSKTTEKNTSRLRSRL